MTENLHCRLCAELTPITDLIKINQNTNAAAANLDYKIFHCFQIQIEIEDKLPKSVCSTCCEQVTATFEFNEKIQKAQEILKSIFIDNKDIKVEWGKGTELKHCELDFNDFVKSEDSHHDFEDNFDFSAFETPKTESDLEDLMLDERISLRKKLRRQKSNKNNTQNKDLSKLELKSKLKKILEEWKNYKWLCSICPMEMESVKELRDHYEREHSKPPEYMCTECSKTYNKYDLFKRHVRAHRNKHKFRCEICGKYSYNKSLHEQHIVRHSKVRKFMCSTCGKSFKTQSSLYIHGRLHLPDEQKYLHNCDICNKKFSSAPNLNLHKKIHLGIKQYTCDQCGNNFTQKINLEHHIISKHTDENPCHCTLCPKVFKNIFRLRRHQAIHNDIKPYECDICGKKYRRGSDLRVHHRIHSGELPYQCEHCKKCFRMKKFLQVHIRQHTGERPYSCLDCNHHFANSSNYIKHMKAKHGISSFKNLTNANANRSKLSDPQFLALEKTINQI